MIVTMRTSIMRVLFTSLAVLLVFSQSAMASSDDFINEELILWSEDGEEWITKVYSADDPGYVQYHLVRRNEVIAKASTIEKLKSSKTMLRLEPAWRTSFASRFNIIGSVSRPDERDDPRHRGRRCNRVWTLSEDGKPLHEHRAQWHCTRAYGGYTHPSRGMVLVKYMDDMSPSDNDGYCCTFTRTYRWLPLPQESAPSPVQGSM